VREPDKPGRAVQPERHLFVLETVVGFVGVLLRQLQFAPMRLFMQTQPTGAGAPRYYQIVLQQDLLGGWMLFREWGQQGAHASSKRETFLERGAALAAFEHARDAQLRRGFQVMFAQGFDGPHGG
jgi:predicted DNA-binding WGR domain protein